MRTLLVVHVLTLCAACSAPGHRSGAIPPPELVSGRILGLAEPTTPTVDGAEAMALDDDMRTFLAEYIGNTSQQTAKLNRLLRGMVDRGFFKLEYVVGDTRTARETFRQRRGNCISFTMLFVSLARAAGLRVSYQIVDVPPVWSSETELMVIANHINALIEMPSGRDYIIDFNERSADERSRRHKITDEQALALFFNNLGAEAMLAGDHSLALHYFREAVAADANTPDPWVNLGLLYVRHDRIDFAEAAYLHALALEPWQRSALTNLATLYENSGRRELAAQYNEQIRRYQQRNPYFHYVHALEAFEESRFDEALSAVARAIKLKHDEHEFHYLMGRTQIELGKLDRAEVSLERARTYAPTDALREKYETALTRLRRDRALAPHQAQTRRAAPAVAA